MSFSRSVDGACVDSRLHYSALAAGSFAGLCLWRKRVRWGWEELVLGVCGHCWFRRQLAPPSLPQHLACRTLTERDEPILVYPLTAMADTNVFLCKL